MANYTISYTFHFTSFAHCQKVLDRFPQGIYYKFDLPGFRKHTVTFNYDTIVGVREKVKSLEKQIKKVLRGGSYRMYFETDIPEDSIDELLRRYVW